jgi:hypothetical protein
LFTGSWERRGYQAKQEVDETEGHLKINVDGSFREAAGIGGWGAVIRDEEGEVVYAAAASIPYVRDALHAEVRHAKLVFKRLGIMGWAVSSLSQIHWY